MGWIPSRPLNSLQLQALVSGAQQLLHVSIIPFCCTKGLRGWRSPAQFASTSCNLACSCSTLRPSRIKKDYFVKDDH